MGFGAGMLSVQTEVGELVANAKKDGISVGMNLPGGKCVDIAFVDADPAAGDLYPTPVRAFTYNGRDEEPDHRADVHLDGAMVLEGRRAPRRRRTSPAMWPRRPGRQPRRAQSAMPTALTTSSTRREA